MKKNTISLTSRSTLAHSLFLKLERDKLHFLRSRINTVFKIRDILIINKLRAKLNNPKNNPFRVISTKTGSSETTIITVTDIFSSNLSYSQSYFSTVLSSAYFYYAVLAAPEYICKKAIVASQGRSKNFTVTVEVQSANYFCRPLTKLIAHPVISQKVSIDGL